MAPHILETRINVPEKELLPGHPYQFVAIVLNPQVVQDYEGMWNLATFNADEASFESGLDEVWMEGFRVNRVMSLWTYRNLDARGLPQVYGRTPVKDLLFQLRFPDRLDSLMDTLVIQAPEGFNLEEEGAAPDSDGLFKCNNFRWMSEGRTSVPQCKANLLKMKINEVTPINPMEIIKIAIDTMNPQVTPLTALNVWSAAHFRVDPIARQIATMTSHMFRSWDVVSQLEQASVRMTGPDYGAGGTGSVEIVFVPMSSANRVVFFAKEPPDFDMRLSGLVIPGQEVVEVEKDHIMMRMIIKARVPITIKIVDMKLGYPGGQTVFDITTFMESVKVDEKLNYDQGFILPGAVHLLYASVKSKFATQPERYPVKSQWSVQLSSYSLEEYQLNTMDPEPPRPKQAEARFKLQLSRDAVENSTFLLRAAQFTIVSPDRFKLTHAEGGKEIRIRDLEVVTTTQVDEENGVRRTLVLADSLRGILTEHIPAFHALELVVSVVSPDASVVEAVRRDGDSRWRGGWLLETREPGADGEEDLPSNTNDAHFNDFKLVRELGFEIWPGRCMSCRKHAPPGAIVYVALRIEPFETDPNELYVTAPLGFEFTENCLAHSPSEVQGCTHLERNKGLAQVRVDVPKGLAPGKTEFVVMVHTPDATPEEPGWYVSAISSFDGAIKQVAWAENERGFDVLQMQLSSVVLPSIPGATVPAAFGFRAKDRLEKTATLTVRLPPNYIPDCRTISFLSIPGYNTVPEREPGCIVTQDSPPHEETLMYRMFITINQTMVPADYSFMVDVTLPSMTPPDHEFSMVLTDIAHVVRDAAMGITVPDMVFGLPLRAHRTPYWEQRPDCIRGCEAKMWVSIVFNVDEVMKEDIKIKHIMLRFPDSVVHEIVVKEGSASSGGRNALALLSASFEYDEIYPELLNQFGFDVAETHWTMPMGEYDIWIPVQMPEYDSGYNVWTLHFCKYGGEAQRCISRQDPEDDPNDDPEQPDVMPEPGVRLSRRRRVILAFPVQGFGIADESPERDMGISFAPIPLLFAVAWLLA
jgi:hypothetical protein